MPAGQSSPPRFRSRRRAGAAAEPGNWVSQNDRAAPWRPATRSLQTALSHEPCTHVAVVDRKQEHAGLRHFCLFLLCVESGVLGWRLMIRVMDQTCGRRSRDRTCTAQWLYL